MAKSRVSTCAFVVAVSLAGCGGTPEPQYPGEVRVMSAKLVPIAPGVQVVADADEPLFYSQGSYWLYRDGYWFSSKSYRFGYTRVEYKAVPVSIRTIDRPELYVQFVRHQQQIAAALAQPPRSRPSYQAYQASPERSYQPDVLEQQPKPPAPEDVTESSTYPNRPHAPGAVPERPNPTQPTTPVDPTQRETPLLPTDHDHTPPPPQANPQ
jgi:hypothetical protein